MNWQVLVFFTFILGALCNGYRGKVKQTSVRSTLESGDHSGVIYVQTLLT